MPAFSFISIGYLFIDLSSSTIEKFALPVALKAATSKVFKIREIADTCLHVLYLSGNVLTKFHGKPSNLHTLLIRLKRRDSLEKRVRVFAF